MEPPIAWNQRPEVEILEKINIGIQSEVETLEFRICSRSGKCIFEKTKYPRYGIWIRNSAAAQWQKSLYI